MHCLRCCLPAFEGGLLGREDLDSTEMQNIADDPNKGIHSSDSDRTEFLIIKTVNNWTIGELPPHSQANSVRDANV
jgi:hypothetical protein